MSTQKTIKTRIQLKNDTTTNWGNASFAPLRGEPILYMSGGTDDASAVVSRVKIGNGLTAVGSLPSYSLVPQPVASTDDGKFLRASGGAPVWVTVPDAEGASF